MLCRRFFGSMVFGLWFTPMIIDRLTFTSSGMSAKRVFRLNCPDGPVELWEDYGATRSQIKGFERELMKNLSQLCGAWEKIHGIA